MEIFDLVDDLGHDYRLCGDHVRLDWMALIWAWVAVSLKRRLMKDARD